MKPLIGINADYRVATKFGPAASFVAAGYYDALARAGALPIVLPPVARGTDLEELLDRLAGVVLIGGHDLDPRRDGYYLHPATHLMAARREEFDREMAEAIYRRRMPVLGIGAGMQLINVVAGGTLSLHIPEDYPKAILHLDPLDLTGHRHAVDIEPGSLLDRVYRTDNSATVAHVTSRHHQAVDDVAPGFVATASCPDGIIEAIESVMEDWLAVGVQWHPESAAATQVDQGLFEEFVKGTGYLIRR